MTIATFALIIGAVYLLAGILGFIPALLSPPLPGDPGLAMEPYYGYLLGIFPVNVLHNVVHVLIGVGGVLAWRGTVAAQSFARFLAVFYGALAVMGLIPQLNTMAGLVPLFRHDVWLHAGSAAVAAYFGWGYTMTRADSRRAQAA
jgi:hypothetical protein